MLGYEYLMQELNNPILDLSIKSTESDFRRAFDYLRYKIVKNVDLSIKIINNVSTWYKLSKSIRNIKLTGITDYLLVSSSFVKNRLIHMYNEKKYSNFSFIFDEFFDTDSSALDYIFIGYRDGFVSSRLIGLGKVEYIVFDNEMIFTIFLTEKKYMLISFICKKFKNK